MKQRGCDIEEICKFALDSSEQPSRITKIDSKFLNISRKAKTSKCGLKKKRRRQTENQTKKVQTRQCEKEGNKTRKKRRQRSRSSCALEKQRRRRSFSKVRRSPGRNRYSRDEYIFEGDMILNKKQRRSHVNSIQGCPKRRGSRGTRNKERYLWPLVNGVRMVTYSFAKNVQVDDRNRVRRVLNNLTALFDLCIRFQEVNIGNRIIVKYDPSRSASNVGYQRGQQQVLLAKFSHQIIVHEFLHALGLKHTQTRSDRDCYVRVITENIKLERVKIGWNLFIHTQSHIKLDKRWIPV